MPKNITKSKVSKKKLSHRALQTLQKAEDLKFSGKHEKAIAVLETLLVQDPSCVEAAEEIADNWLSLDQFEKAQKAAEFAFSLDSQSFIANHVLGFLQLHQENWDEALKFLKVANESCSNHPEILRCLGWGLFHAGKKNEGMVTIERALTLDRKNPMILCDLGVCFLQENKIESARALFERAIQLSPKNHRAKECLQIIEKISQSSSKA